MSQAVMGRASAPSHGFSPAMKALHWITPVLLIGAYALAWSIDSAQSKEQALWLIMLHRSFGISILLLTLLRLVWRQMTRVPPLPDDVPAPQRLAARAAAIGLYLLLFLQPLLGLVASAAHGDHIVVFGGIELPALMATNRPLSRQLFAIHGLVALALLGLISVHATAALYHHFIRKDDVLRGMLPRRGGAVK